MAAAASPTAAPRPRRGRPPRPQASGLRERAWWLLRRVRQTTVDDLLMTLAGEEHGPNADVSLGEYLRALERCGVVKRLQRRAAGASPYSPGRVIWRLVRDLGRLAPVWRKSERALWDPNARVLVQPVDRAAASSATAGATGSAPAEAGEVAHA